jgi:hypothetical protein
MPDLRDLRWRLSTWVLPWNRGRVPSDEVTLAQIALVVAGVPGLVAVLVLEPRLRRALAPPPKA